MCENLKCPYSIQNLEILKWPRELKVHDIVLCWFPGNAFTSSLVAFMTMEGSRRRLVARWWTPPAHTASDTFLTPLCWFWLYIGTTLRNTVSA